METQAQLVVYILRLSPQVIDVRCELSCSNAHLNRCLNWETLKEMACFKLLLCCQTLHSLNRWTDFNEFCNVRWKRESAWEFLLQFTLKVSAQLVVLYLFEYNLTDNHLILKPVVFNQQPKEWLFIHNHLLGNVIDFDLFTFLIKFSDSNITTKHTAIKCQQSGRFQCNKPFAEPKDWPITIHGGCWTLLLP